MSLRQVAADERIKKIHIEFTDSSSFQIEKPAILTSYATKDAHKFICEKDTSSWVSSFLTHSASKNSQLLLMLSRKAVFLCAPVYFDVKKLIRIAGPGKRYHIDESVWEGRIKLMASNISDVDKLPPAIVSARKKVDRAGKTGFELADGAHRYEALSRLGHEVMPVIFWGTKTKQIMSVIQEIRGE